MAWTTDQLNAIKARDCNLLVSAAAGSGKTAVLVERIIQRVLDKDNPVDIDSIMVVTFTKAAAGEMKGRLLVAFEKALKSEPGNRHLIRQLALVENAKITTIDSFCYDVVKNYYNTIDLDPNIRIADAGELSLVKEEVLDNLLEECFKSGDKDFIGFVEAFAPGKSISRISELVNGLYNFSQSNPWPMEWLMDCKKQYDVRTIEEFENLPVVQYITEHIRVIAKEHIKDCEYIIQCCNETDGPVEYIPVIARDKAVWDRAAEEDNYFKILAVLEQKFDNLPRSTSSNPEIREYVKEIREKYKNTKKKLLKEFSSNATKQLEEMAHLEPFVRVLVYLTMEFSRRYQLCKQEKNIADFSDIEHYALDILLHKENDKIIHTYVADELAENFTEIYIDEYQDSNFVQEYLLNAVSRERFGTPNIFMVGDVKQSIYKFRMARPEIFMEKYDRYTNYGKSAGKYQKIELHMNFRSRQNVLESINDVFHKAMQESLGGIEYTDEVRLNAGQEFAGGFDDVTELILMDEKEIKAQEIDDKEAAAHIAAGRIKEIMKNNPELNYRDFAILLRSDKSSGPIYANILSSHGIPCAYNSTTGYFSSYEVVNVLDLLNVIDNPRQEIPLAGVMRSYFAHFTIEEMAVIKGPRRRTELYDCVVKASGEESALGSKCRDFLTMLNNYRQQVGIFSTREMVSDIIYNTGYYDYISAIPGGQLKKTNLDMLAEMAAQYENTSYHGLFNFLRYIEKLQKYDVDYGEGGAGEGEVNQVKIMSIHKSKGLEFPVVIVGDFGKKYNLRDTTSGIIYDNSYGIGMDYVDLGYRTKTKTGYKGMIAKKLTIDSIGEELRILYVAMTRAVNKLILIGKDNIETSYSKWERMSHSSKLDINYLMDNTKYSAVVAPCAINNSRYRCDFISASRVMEVMSQAFGEHNEIVTDNLTEINKLEVNGKIYELLQKILEYQYPHCNVLSVKSKYSVSDLKHQAMEETEILEERFKMSEPEKTIPKFLGDEAPGVGGVLRGNAYHKVFEILDYKIEPSKAGVNRFLDDMVDCGRLTEEYRSLINPDKFVQFMESPLGRDMKEAYLSDKLFREQPFIMEVGANEVDASYPAEEKVLVQGIVDAFYITDNKVSIVDYKTDAVPMENGEEILIERYRKQLLLYKDALTKITQLEVNKISIYSVSLNKEVEII